MARHHYRRHRPYRDVRHPRRRWIVGTGNPPAPPSPPDTDVAVQVTVRPAAVVVPVHPKLARGGLTAEEVDFWLHSSDLRTYARFDILDIITNNTEEALAIAGGEHQKIGELTTVEKTAGAAVVDYNTGSKLRRRLKLKMQPDERLREAALQVAIKPYYILVLPDGHELEFPQGVYPWNVPDRLVHPTLEVWEIPLADICWFLDTASPDFGGFNITNGTRDTEAIKDVLNLGKVFDHSGVEDSEHRVVGTRSWGLQRIEYHSGYYGQFFFIHGDHRRGQTNTRTTTLLDICADLHQGIGYYAPFGSVEGVYQAIPARDLRTVTPAATFGTAQRSITYHNITTSSDRQMIANRVFVFTANPVGSTFIGIADADKLYPGHPWSAAKIGHHLTRVVEDPGADLPDKAQALAEKELAESLTYYQKVTFDTYAYPVLEPFDVVGLYVEGDSELGEMTPFLSEQCSFDLHTSQMRHTARRIFQPVDVGVIDTGLADEQPGVPPS